MLVFIDESGDPGMKLGGGSSPYFVVTLILIEDPEEATALEQRIVLLKRELGLSPNFEFHFSQLKGVWREEFLQAVSRYEWFSYTVVINKSLLTGKGFLFPDSFYKYTFGLVFQNAKPHLRDATVVIDGSGAREFRRQLSAYLRKRISSKDGTSKLIRKIKLQDSCSNHLLQLADMVCGAIARDHNKPDESARYRKLVSHREVDVQVWPK
jgi:hypothetical protein